MFTHSIPTNHYAVHLLIPELFAYHNQVAPDLRLDNLEKLLSRAYVEEWAYPDWMASLFALFDLPVNPPLPIAPITRLSDANDSGDKIWLRADPVHLHVDRDRVLLFDSSLGFTITSAEANTLINEINQLYEASDLPFSAPTPTRWYVSLSQQPELLTHPLSEVLGKNMGDYLPSGKDKTQWWQILNEIQMLLHQSQVNTEREARGELSINSIWFWGLGQLPTVSTQRWSHIWTDDPLAQGLAQLAQLPHTPVSRNGKEWLAHLTPGEHLLTRLLPSLNFQQWHTWLTELETEWFLPLFEALKKRQLDVVALYLGQDQVFVITQTQVRHWWKRQRHWQSFISS